jgi:hypothetical protein
LVPFFWQKYLKNKTSIKNESLNNMKCLATLQNPTRSRPSSSRHIPKMLGETKGENEILNRRFD